MSLKDSALKRGAMITAINNVPIAKIIDSMCQFIGSDGYAYNLKYQLISFNFPAYYRNTFGVDSQYVINYVDSNRQQKQTVVKNFNPLADSLSRLPLPVRNVSKKQFRDFKAWSDRNMIIDTALSTAVLSVNTFSEGNLNRFFRRSFRKIKERQIKNVVLDLRQNSGGNILSSTRLCQYLVDKPFRVADTVASYTRSFPYKKYIRPWFVYWTSMHLTGRRFNDGRIHFKYFERHNYKPVKRDHFNGNIYLVTGGYTFSAAALVTSTLIGQSNVKVVGEETGGGAYGNTAMHLPTIILPNSGIRVTLPLYRMVLDASRPKNGRGIFPDIEVKPTSFNIRRGVDGKIEKVRELIRKSNDTGIANVTK
jgi:C-terminal processing protease CtpA/Prc